MTSQQLQTYLREIVDLEIKYRATDKACLQHKRQMVGYGVPKQYTMPEKPEEPKESYGKVLLSILKGILFIGAIWILFPSLDEADSTFGKVLWVIKILLVGFTCLLAMFMIPDDWKDVGYKRSCYNSALREYKVEKGKYNALVSRDKARVQKEQPHLPALKQKGQLLSEQRERAWNTLQKFYDLGILHKDYRNMVCVTTFLDYLEKGICTTLTGHEGCYVLFEQQARMGIIISKLTNIENKLDQIQENQRYLLAAMDSIESSCRNISQKINSLDYKMGELIDEAKIQSYNTQQIAAEQQAMNNYVIIRDWMML